MMTTPKTLTDHAVDQYIERWVGQPRGGVRARTYYGMHLTMMLPLAIHVEDVLDENQSIWSLDLTDVTDPWDTRPAALLVVGPDGTVRTILPAYAKRPAGRRRHR